MPVNILSLSGIPDFETLKTTGIAKGKPWSGIFKNRHQRNEKYSRKIIGL